MVRFQRQPPGTAITRGLLIGGGLCAAAGGALVATGAPLPAAAVGATGGVLLLVGGHRANHGAGGPTDRVLDELLDRGWDAAMLGAVAWVNRVDDPRVSAGALVALCASFLSAYVRARGASLGYSVEESHLTRAVRYGLVCLGLGIGGMGWIVWVVAAISVLAALVRTGQVAREERA